MTLRWIRSLLEGCVQNTEESCLYLSPHPGHHPHQQHSEPLYGSGSCSLEQLEWGASCGCRAAMVSLRNISIASSMGPRGGVGLGVRNCLFLLVQRVGIQECIVDEDRSKQREVLRCHREARLVGPDIFFK